MSSRADASCPLAHARRKDRATRAIPSRQNPSTMGFVRLQVNGSISCVKASSPVLAVTAGGTPQVSSGSTIAMRGIIVTFRRLALTLWAGEVNTALRVT